MAPPSSQEALVRQMVAALIRRIGEQRYNLWFVQQTTLVPLGTDLAVVVASSYTQEWLEQAFGADLRAAAAEVLGDRATIRVVVDPALLTGEAKSTLPVSNPKPEPTKSPQYNLFGDRIDPPPAPEKPRRTAKSGETPRTARRFKSLADFVVGSSNRVAHASALSLVEDPGQVGNPLVFHGPVGTGKTHLLEGIYAGLRRQSSEARPTYVTAEEFTTRFVQAARFGKQAAFRRQFRDCSALLLDDLHFLATKKGTQEEFLHTFDSLVSDGRPVVVTTDCHPRLAEELMPELVDRLLGGAIWGLLPPDDETRLGILRAKSVGGIAIPDEVLKYLARNLKGNVRELEGAIHGVRHYARVTARPVDQALVREALGDLLRHTVRAITLAEVDAAVCSVLNLSAGQLQSKARSWSVSHPRMIATFLARKHTAATYGEIAKHFGAKQHSSAVAAEKKVRGWIQNDEPLSLGNREWRTRDLIARLERELQR